MSFESLLVQRCDIIHYGETGTDRTNHPIYGETSRDSDVPCRIDEILISAAEVIVGRDTAQATHRLFLGPSQVIEFQDVVESGDVTYRVTGPPAKVWDSYHVHHIEANLQTVSDLDWSAYP